MRRRELIIGLGGAVAAPTAGRAQRSEKVVIGFLGSEAPGPFADLVAAFRKGLAEQGYVEGRNLAIEFRWADGDKSRLPGLAAELVRRRVAVIATGGGANPALAAKAATATIPIVFNIGGDPVALGLVKSLAHPDGNITGATVLTAGLVAKRLGLLHMLVPKAARIAALVNPTNANIERERREITNAAQQLGIAATILEAGSDSEIDAALSKSRVGDSGAVLVGADPFFFIRRDRIVRLIAGLNLPAIYEWAAFVKADGLVSYGTSLADGYRQVGIYTGRILKGARPAGLPVVQSSRFHLAINLKTANALGLTVPQLLLAQADEVVE